jgi:hypothetical protein
LHGYYVCPEGCSALDFAKAEAKTLAAEYSRDVRARRAAGDARPEYHAQRPKVRAYAILMRRGMTPREAVDYFRSVSEEQ